MRWCACFFVWRAFTYRCPSGCSRDRYLPKRVTEEETCNQEVWRTIPIGRNTPSNSPGNSRTKLFKSSKPRTPLEYGRLNGFFWIKSRNSNGFWPRRNSGSCSRVPRNASHCRISEIQKRQGPFGTGPSPTFCSFSTSGKQGGRISAALPKAISRSRICQSIIAVSDVVALWVTWFLVWKDSFLPYNTRSTYFMHHLLLSFNNPSARLSLEHETERTGCRIFDEIRKRWNYSTHERGWPQDCRKRMGSIRSGSILWSTCNLCYLVSSPAGSRTFAIPVRVHRGSRL